MATNWRAIKIFPDLLQMLALITQMWRDFGGLRESVASPMLQIEFNFSLSTGTLDKIWDWSRDLGPLIHNLYVTDLP